MFTRVLRRLCLSVIGVFLLAFADSRVALRAATAGDAAAAADVTSLITNAPLTEPGTNRDLAADLRAAQVALEQARQDAAAAARRSDEAMTERLAAIEQALTSQAEREQRLLLESSHTLFVASVSLGGIGLLMLLLAVWFQVRALNRLAEITRIHRELMALALPPGAGAGVLPAVAGNEVAAASQRLLGALGGLDRRLREWERGSSPGAKAGDDGLRAANGGKPTGPVPAPPTPPGGAEPRIAATLERGRVFLNNGQLAQAQACFEQVLALEPNHAEGLLQKGLALQQQRKLEEALACYDRAIAANSALSLAYLYKGGICNQLERFDEALECYEQAQRLQKLAGGALTGAGA